jgi:hypothetical protein
MELGTLTEQNKEDHNQYFKIQYLDTERTREADRIVAYPANYSFEDIASSIESDLVKTGKIEPSETREQRIEQAKTQATEEQTEAEATYLTIEIENEETIKLVEKSVTVQV